MLSYIFYFDIVTTTMTDISLLSPHALAEKHHRALLLQFILHELIRAHAAFQNGETVYCSLPQFFPYDWASEPKALNRAEEHAKLLKRSFSDQEKSVKKWETSFSKLVAANAENFFAKLQEVIAAIEPLLKICKEDENLILFLLKRRTVLDAIMRPSYIKEFLLYVHPNGLESLGEKMCDKYHQRGFLAQIPEFKLLITELIHV